MTEQPPITYELSTPTDRPEGGGRNVKGLVIGGIVAVVVLALAGGAFAVVKKLDGGGAQPHDVLPASVIAYARVDVDPSASQKIALFKLIRKFPDAADEIGIKSADQDVRKLLVEEALKEGGCDLKYDKDVEPWLGNRIGVAVDQKETPLVAIQVTNEKKAETGIKALFTCADEKAAVAFLDGYAIVAKTQKQADAAVKAAQKAPLAEKKAFVKDFEDLGEQGVASAWADFKGLAKIPDFRAGFEMGADESGIDGEKMLDQMGSVATAVRVDGSTLELTGQFGLTDIYDLKGARLDKLPADTVAALSIGGGLGDQIVAQYDAFLDQFTQGMEEGLDDESITEDMTPEEKAAYEAYLEDNPIGSADPEDFIAGFEEQSGLQLPEDIETLFGDGLTLAIGSKNLEDVPTFSGPDEFASLDVALQMTTDPSKALDLAERLAALATQVGLDLSTKKTDDGAVIATNQEMADSMDGSGKLGEDATFKSVMPYGKDTMYGIYVDLSTILDKVSESGPPKDVAEDIDQAKALKAVGYSMARKDKHTVFTLRVAFSK